MDKLSKTLHVCLEIDHTTCCRSTLGLSKWIYIFSLFVLRYPFRTLFDSSTVNLVPYVKSKDLPAVTNEPRRMVTEMPVISPGEPPTSCAGCGGHIADRNYLQAVDRHWHCSCLKCHVCKAHLDTELSCFYKDGHIYCKEDYYR